MDMSRKRLPTANPPVAPSLDEEVHSHDKIFREIKDYAMEEEQVQAGDPPYTCLHRTSGGRMEQVRPGRRAFNQWSPIYRP